MIDHSEGGKRRLGGLVEERIPALITIALNSTHDDQQHAVNSLWRLSWDVDEHLVEIVHSGLVPPVVALLRDGTADTFTSGETHGKEIAAGFLRDLARFNEQDREDDKNTIIDQIVCAGAIPSLVALVRDGDSYAGLCAVRLLEVLFQFDGYSEGVYTTPYGGYGCVAVMGAGGIAPLISLARDGVPLAQKSACVVLAAFGEHDHPIPVLLREGIAVLVREGAIPLLMALACGSSDSELSRSSDI